MTSPAPVRVLDIGIIKTLIVRLFCGGGQAFELSKDFEVVGLDSDKALIEAANEMKDKRQISYKLNDEGDKLKEFVAKIGTYN